MNTSQDAELQDLDVEVQHVTDHTVAESHEVEKTPSIKSLGYPIAIPHIGDFINKRTLASRSRGTQGDDKNVIFIAFQGTQGSGHVLSPR